MKKHSRFRVARGWLIFWCLFIGVGAVAGASGMLVAPDGSAMGMQAMLPSFQVLPFADILFQDFFFPGIALLCVNGIPNLLAAALLFARKKSGIVLGGIFGVTLMLWICIQFVIFPFNFLSTAYFIFGLIQAATGYAAWVFYHQEQFAERLAQEDYPNIGANNRRELVVFFSRMGYTEKIALAIANESGADLLVLSPTEPTEGTRGFWWCGRFAMHRWAMPVRYLPTKLSAYEKVTICTPIWVFAICAPVRRFCQEANGQIKRADYVLVHHQPWNYPGAVEEMDRLLGLKHENVRSICCHIGRYKDCI